MIVSNPFLRMAWPSITCFTSVLRAGTWFRNLKIEVQNFFCDYLIRISRATSPRQHKRLSCYGQKSRRRSAWICPAQENTPRVTRGGKAPAAKEIEIVWNADCDSVWYDHSSVTSFAGAWKSASPSWTKRICRAEDWLCFDGKSWKSIKNLLINFYNLNSRKSQRKMAVARRSNPNLFRRWRALIEVTRDLSLLCFIFISLIPIRDLTNGIIFPTVF